MKYRVIEIIFTGGTKMYSIQYYLAGKWEWRRPPITEEGRNSPRIHGYFSTKQQAIDALYQFIVYTSDKHMESTTVVYELESLKLN